MDRSPGGSRGWSCCVDPHPTKRMLPVSRRITPAHRVSFGKEATPGMVRFYVGVEFDLDVQLVLRAEEVPECHLAVEPT